MITKYSLSLMVIIFFGGYNNANLLANDKAYNELNEQYICKYNIKQNKERTIALQKYTFIDDGEIHDILVKGGYLGPCATYESKRSMGNGNIQSYVQMLPNDTPYSVGIEVSSSALKKLPTNVGGDGNSCFDLNNDGIYQPKQNECLNHFEYILDLPGDFKKLTAFKWLLVNWNPYGHVPQDIYSVPHFDFHFYIQNFIQRNMIATGDYQGLASRQIYDIAIKDVPIRFMPKDYINVKGVEARMGNHLIDKFTPEINGNAFTKTFIYGSYDGHLTFWEPMITMDYLKSKPNLCIKLKLPQEYEITGYYPTKYCIVYNKIKASYRISLEGFTNN